MKPFVLLATRAEDDIALEEYDAVRRFGGLEESQLEHLRLEQPIRSGRFVDGWAGGGKQISPVVVVFY